MTPQKLIGLVKIAVAATAASFGLAHSLPAADATLDTARITAITGLNGTLNAAEGDYKVSKPRTDVPIQVDGWTMPPFMGVTSWAAFKPAMPGQVMVMGDLVLFEDEVNAVMSAALDHGLEVTALHNHFFYSDPAVYFMHIGGMGPLETMAGGVKAALDASAKVRAAKAQPAKTFGDAALPATSAVPADALDAVFGAKGTRNSGMEKFVFGRTVTMMGGVTAAGDMGVNTWAAFAGTADNALVDGDFVCKETELQKVLQTLRSRGINIVAIHSHMIEETPRMIFLHYWGRGQAADLAKAVKAALDTQSK